MKVSEVRTQSQSVDEMKSELQALLKAQFGLRMQLATQQSTKTDQLKKMRRDIARVRTLLTEKASQA